MGPGNGGSADASCCGTTTATRGFSTRLIRTHFIRSCHAHGARSARQARAGGAIPHTGASTSRGTA